MGGMKDTLGDQPYPLSPGFKERSTSRDAAMAMKSTSETLRRRVLAEYRAAGAHGLTADEAAEKLGCSILAIRPRCSELKATGKIEKTTMRRKNSSGMNAAVMRAVV